MNWTKSIKLLSGPVAALLIYFFVDLDPQNRSVTEMAAVTAWVAVWWLTEAVHLAVTSLLPFVLLPMLGIVDSRIVASQYMDPIIFLFIGGFIIAFAIERWGLHKRIALKILNAVGPRPSRILFGVMITSFLFSMWISNTATVMMLISAVFAVIYQVEDHIADEKQRNKLSAALLIGLAYSATIGGMATLVGTPTNMIFLRAYTEAYPKNNDMNFTSWFATGFPIALVFLLITFFVLRAMFVKKETVVTVDRSFFKTELLKLGKMNFEEKVTAVIFSLTALLWFTREDIDFGSFRLYGWNNLFPEKKFIHDGTVAVFMATLLFLIPSRKEKGRALLTWEESSKLPFDIILLFGSGFALAKGFEISGLSNWMAGKLQFLDKSGLALIILSICVIVTLISEFASNVASIQLVIPILISMQKVLDVHPLVLMIPATLAASLGFMLPVATAPNTIVFSSKRIKVSEMVMAGLVLDIVGVLLISAVVMWVYG